MIVIYREDAFFPFHSFAKGLLFLVGTALPTSLGATAGVVGMEGALDYFKFLLTRAVNV